ncbi:MAG TPA: NAD+ synthase, partial [Actinomycetota bacterium]|nr:NAD+ synthase [Actinomycetota bacterium]
MAAVRIALAQINPTVGDLEGNRWLIERAIAAARVAGADLVALPELAITGYPPEDLVLRPSFVADNLRTLEELAPAATGITAVVGFVDRDGDRIFNAAAVIAGGRVEGVYHKHLLPNYGVFDEKRYFTPGDEILIERVAGIPFGVTICEDIWSSDGPQVATAAAGAELIVNINGSPYHMGKGRERQRLLASRARENHVAFAYVNMVGGQDELVFDGQSCAFDAGGALLARGPQFAEDLLVYDHAAGLDAEGVRGSYSPERGGPVAPEMGSAEEVYAALVLGVRDYLTKNGFHGACLGLSGGIDSSLTAAVAADALGAGNVMGVLMPSEYTSEESLTGAQRLAGALGIPTVTLPIHDAYEVMLKILDPVFAGTEPGLAEENLQSRIRGNLLMAISNKTGRLVLSTGNKSEM